MSTAELPIDRVRPNPNQPRKIFEAGALEDLARSIDELGLLQAILVRPAPDGMFEIVTGERRWRAHVHLGRATICAEVRTMSDEEMAEAAIVENLQRKDITPLEEARAFQARLDAGVTVEQLAKRLGLKQHWRITERTSLLKLAPEFQEALRCNAITPSQAFEMSRHPVADQRALFAALESGKCHTYSELRALSQALIDRRNQTEMFAGYGEKSDEEKRAIAAVERRIERLAAFVRASFDRDNQPNIARHIAPRKAEALAAELKMVEQHVRALRLSLVGAGALT